MFNMPMFMPEISYPNFYQIITNLESKINNLEKEINSLKNIINNLNMKTPNNYQPSTYNMM